MQKIAIVLNGGVDRGAYQAGALQALFEVLPQDKHYIVVGTSIGALNGAILADGIAANKGKEKTKKLVNLWINEISPQKIFGKTTALMLWFFLQLCASYKKFSLMLYTDIFLFIALNFSAVVAFLKPGALHPAVLMTTKIFLLGEFVLAILLLIVFKRVNQGYLINNKNIKQILTENVTSTATKKVPLVITATSLSGELQNRVVTYETQFIFPSMQQREKIIDAAVASSAIPIIFPASRIKKRMYVDGGVKNNTPLNYAIDQGADTIILITHQPREKPSRRLTFGPFEKLSRIGEILLYDSIANDLRRAQRINQWLKQLKKFKNQSIIKRALNLHHKRPITIIEIRPKRELGGWFEALYDKKRRQEYIQQGYVDAKKKEQEIKSILAN